MSEGEAMSAGREHEVSCRAHAGRPPPVLTMWLQGQQLHGEQEVRVPCKAAIVHQYARFSINLLL